MPKPRTVAPKVDNPLVAALLRTPGADAPDLAPKAKRQRKPNLKRKLSKDPHAPRCRRGGGIQPVLQNIVFAACKQLPDRFQFCHVMQVIPQEHFRAVQVMLTKLVARGYLDRQKVERVEMKPPGMHGREKRPTKRRRVYSYTLTEKGRTTDVIPALHHSVRNLQRPDGGDLSEDAVPARGVGRSVHQPAGSGGEGNAS